jgi:hypothetical protein
MGRRGESRFVRFWLAPLVLVVVAAGLAGILFSFYNSWWVDPTRPPSSDQRAADGTTVFTAPGIEYATATGLLIIRVSDEALDAAQLGLDDDAVRTVDPEVPVEVRILGTDGALVLELVDAVSVTTVDGAIARVELAPWGSGQYREYSALLESRADTIGWTAEDLSKLESDLSAAQRVSDDGTYSARLPPSRKIGAEVTALLSVDLGSAYTSLVIAVEPIPVA